MDCLEPDHQPELRALESRLRRWQPAASGLDRDRLLFESGRAAAGRGPRTGVMVGILSLALVGLATAWWSERAGRQSAEDELASYKAPAPASKPHELDEPPAPLKLAHADRSSYLVLRQLLEESGSIDQMEPADKHLEPQTQRDTPEHNRPLGPRSRAGAIDL